MIFAFDGSALFAASLHMVQRTGHTKLFAGKLACFTFWGWNVVILPVAVGCPMGLTQGCEYAQMIWPIDLLIAAIRVSFAMAFFSTVGMPQAAPHAVAVGGLVETVTLFLQKSTTQPIEGLKPCSPPKLAGCDVHVRKGRCSCHSPMIRPLQAETLRCGPCSVAGKYVHDHLFQRGSKRTGLDLHRVGGRCSDKSTASTG